MKKTLGGDRIGSGAKMTVDLHTYNRSTHDMGYIFRSTMAAGTLVPFLVEVALPGDTFDINLDANVLTHPTVGPLFGSYKLQLDVFECPIRLYNALLHNNALNIGMNMSAVKLPKFHLTVPRNPVSGPLGTTLDNTQINPSCLLAYLGIRGIGYNSDDEADHQRSFNGTALLAYWDTYKNYYANKQEEIGAVIHTAAEAPITTVDNIKIDGVILNTSGANINLDGGASGVGVLINTNYTPPANRPKAKQIVIITDFGDFTIEQLQTPGTEIEYPAGLIMSSYNFAKYGTLKATGWRYITPQELNTIPPNVITFPLDDIDDMRQAILQNGSGPFIINDEALNPYNLLLGYVMSADGPFNNVLGTQEGLAIKTYQSDIFNNWLKTEWIDGPSGITAVTAIDTSEGSFTIDTLNLSKKVYEMLNRIAVSGGTYYDWIDAVYTSAQFFKAETPIYHGGLSKELIFQEVVSNSASNTAEGSQPLGTLAGRGRLSEKHKGGQITIKCTEPAYILGLVSLTPRIDYSQGNKWDVHLTTLDDLHKPALDEIGFQELITEQMAFWDTHWDGTKWVQRSAGKQPAWINYMTNYNRTFGNFAIPENEMFMTLNRRYEMADTGFIKDLTTYIDPAKFNQIFAQTTTDAQNFWTQIAVDMIVRRLMSARIMPNL